MDGSLAIVILIGVSGALYVLYEVRRENRLISQMAEAGLGTELLPSDAEFGDIVAGIGGVVPCKHADRAVIGRLGENLFAVELRPRYEYFQSGQLYFISRCEDCGPEMHAVSRNEREPPLVLVGHGTQKPDMPIAFVRVFYYHTRTDSRSLVASRRSRRFLDIQDFLSEHGACRYAATQGEWRAIGMDHFHVSVLLPSPPEAAGGPLTEWLGEVRDHMRAFIDATSADGVLARRVQDAREKPVG